ncbi:hypothetical protein F5144DRAFT_482650 [Chaetomium tenue]|uniref:Uncharacterized protein n=1 Tax=Chaetomium tenue TaxID=1854479 RepID=A0ACB7PGZ9_9PEZI|nr:hypothetical protein F5144DRAFT_482650 [Chaetomium globosum]
MGTTTADWRRTVFRLSKIPNRTRSHGAVRALVAKAMEIPAESVKVFSLATSLTPWEMPPSKVATLMFLKPPAMLGRPDEGQVEWVLDADEYPVLDSHFWGLTPLNDVEPEKHIADCIAISGLASHPFGSWQPRGDDKTFMWIRDVAPMYVPGLRTILYGYDTKLAGSHSFQGISHLALGFISQIRANGGALDHARPLVFLAHSLGGIVLKDALCRLANSQDNSLERKILTRCKGAIMFGVPNLGMEQSHLLTLVQGHSIEHLVQDLSRESATYGYLSRLERSFAGISNLGEMTFYWVFETDKSPIFDAKTRKMTGPSAILVDPDSATAHRIKESAPSVHPIARNHSEMVKFSRADPNTGPIIHLLRRVCGLSDAATEPDDLGAQSDSLAKLMTSAKFRSDDPDSGFLLALDSPDLDLRQALIANRFGHTCEWIYEHEPFTSWLRQDDGIFWINGKPGSGKSTLMKLIYTDKRTWQYSHDFEDSTCQISAGFFFNYRGTVIQKTLEGLMRSVLRQIIKSLSNNKRTLAFLDSLFETPAFRIQDTSSSRESRRGEPALLPQDSDQLHEAHRYIRRMEQMSWPIDRLKEALRSILDQSQVKIRIIFFLDALDEFDGPPAYVCRFLNFLAKRPDSSLTTTKLCFSSRPWEEFVSHFGGEMSLSVEDFTKSDIRYFCTTHLIESLDHSRHGPVSRIADEIVLRASGVFLWASLILKELMAAFEGDKVPSLKDLLRLLHSVPTELSDYYHFIIQRIPQSLRWQTYALLELVVRARNPKELSLHYLWKTTLISDSPTYPAALETLKKLNTRGHKSSTNEPQRSVLQWGGGLVSMSFGLFTADPSSPTVQLMHQTVYEFVVKLDFKDQVLGSMAKATYENGHTFHFKSLVSFRLTEELIRVHHMDMLDALRPSMDHGAEAEETTGTSCQAFLDSVPDHVIIGLGVGLMDILKFSGLYLYDKFRRDLIRSHVAFATYFRLRLYLRDSLRDQESYFTSPACNKLLLLTALALGSRETHTHQRLLTANFILDNGYNASQESDLFADTLDPLKVHSWYEPWETQCIDGLDRLTALLLDHDPGGANSPVWGNRNNKSRTDTCRPIHLGLPTTTTWLLGHGINPNELDSLGRTPLDVLMLDRVRRCQDCQDDQSKEFEKTYLLVIRQVAIILIDHGGRRKVASRANWESALRYFQRAGLDTANLPPGLQPLAEMKDRQKKPKPVPKEAASPAWPLPPTAFTTNDGPPTTEKRSLGRSVRRFLSKWH